MKAKKIALLLAGIVSAAALSACTDPNRKVDWGDYWKKDTLSAETVNETLTYSVKFKGEMGINNLGYTLTYGEGSYITTLQNVENPTEYVYTSTLTMPVTFTLGEETKNFTDTVTTEVKLMNAGNSLRPIYSKKTVVSHTPASAAGSSVEYCYATYEYELSTTYQEDGNATSIVTLKDKDPISTDFTYGDGDYGYLDNEQILLSLRCVPANTTSATVEVFNPFLKGTQLVQMNFDAKTGGEFSHTVGGAPLPSKDISYRPVRLALNGKNPGGTQLAWIATGDSTSKNTHRNVMLYLETPLSYNIGALQYTLTAVVNA